MGFVGEEPCESGSGKFLQRYLVILPKKSGGRQSLRRFHSFLMSPRVQDIPILTFYRPQRVDLFNA